MVSNIDTARRALVTLLESLAVVYGVVTVLTRESTDVQVRSNYTKVSRKPSAAEHTLASMMSHLVAFGLGLGLSGWSCVDLRVLICLCG